MSKDICGPCEALNNALNTQDWDYVDTAKGIPCEGIPCRYAPRQAQGDSE